MGSALCGGNTVVLTTINVEKDRNHVSSSPRSRQHQLSEDTEVKVTATADMDKRAYNGSRRGSLQLTPVTSPGAKLLPNDHQQTPPPVPPRSPRAAPPLTMSQTTRWQSAGSGVEALKKEAAASVATRSLSDPIGIVRGSAPNITITADNSTSSPKSRLAASNSSTGSSDKLQPSLSNLRLQRGLSTLADNAGMLDSHRLNILHNLSEETEETGGGGLASSSTDDMMESTFVLPDLSGYEQEFRDYVMRVLVERSTFANLERTGHLNWWIDRGLSLHLVPLATDGDGNCLLHAASLAMWGFHDRQLTLRAYLNSTVTEGRVRDSMYRRWRWQQTQSNMELGLTLSSEQWAAEWAGVLKLSSVTPKHESDSQNTNSLHSGGRTKSEQPEGAESRVYESLEEFHVFVLAHVLRRPIIVVADSVMRNVDNEAMAPIPFGGIYLPLERNPADCFMSPLLLAYDASHFSALVMSHGYQTAGRVDNLIPVVDATFNLLPLHFAVDPGQSFSWEKTSDKKMKLLELSLREKVKLLQRYLHIKTIPVPSELDTSAVQTHVVCNPIAIVNRNLPVDDFKDATKSTQKVTNGAATASERSASKSAPKSSSSKMRDSCEELVDCLTRSDGNNLVCARVQVKLPDYYEVMVDAFLRTNREAYAVATGNQKTKSRKGDEVAKTTAAKTISDGEGMNSFSSATLPSNAHRRRSVGALANGEPLLLGSGVLQAKTTAADYERSSNGSSKSPADVRDAKPIRCINPECTGEGSVERFYLCEACYQRQRREELNLRATSSLVVASSSSAANSRSSDGKQTIGQTASDASDDRPTPTTTNGMRRPSSVGRGLALVGSGPVTANDRFLKANGASGRRGSSPTVTLPSRAQLGSMTSNKGVGLDDDEYVSLRDSSIPGSLELERIRAGAAKKLESVKAEGLKSGQLHRA